MTEMANTSLMKMWSVTDSVTVIDPEETILTIWNESSEFGDACPVAGCMDSTACNLIH